MPYPDRTTIVSYSNDGLNDDFSTPVIVKTNLYDWSVKTKIVRKRLEYIDINGPWLTTLVQYPAGLTFKKCSHNRGEEFLVLSGDFSNDERTYHSGAYVRNPPGMRFTSATRYGCLLLFKTGQFQKMDLTQRATTRREYDHLWVSAGEPGVSRIELHQFLDESVNLYQIRPQCWITFKQCTQGIEVFIYEGLVMVEGVTYTTGTWFRYPPHSQIKIVAISNTCLYVKKRKYTC